MSVLSQTRAHHSTPGRPTSDVQQYESGCGPMFWKKNLHVPNVIVWTWFGSTVNSGAARQGECCQLSIGSGSTYRSGR